MVYSVKEIYYTLQGEGMNTGRPAVFCRFAGCNLWTGLEKDRAKAICRFCDTDFVGTDGPGGGKFKTAGDLVAAIARQWPDSGTGQPLVVFTGGEPLLQLDAYVNTALHAIGWEVAVETNGTIEPPAGIDHLCVSPKIGSDMIVTKGQELKLVYPQAGGNPVQFETLDFDAFYLQPMDSDAQAENTAAAVEYCKSNPKWRLSVQTHKMVGIP